MNERSLEMKNQIDEERKQRDELLARMRTQGVDFHPRKRGDREKIQKKEN